MSIASARGAWGSRTGFILAAAGSAVGLGNIWGFPTQVGQGGGAAFVLVYLFCVLFICFPILVAEIAIGRRARQSPVGSFQTLRPGSSWWLVGALGVLTGAGILSFYSVIAGWTIAYMWFTVTGALAEAPQDVNSFFSAFIADGSTTVLLTFAILLLTALILLGGVRTGIERATKTLMPALLVLLIVLAVRAMTLPGAAAGLAYYLEPDFSQLRNVNVFNSALGQAFFSLSLGMGTMITYGSYLNKRNGIANSTMWIVLLDTSIAFLAGLIIFPAGFSIDGFDPSANGPGLIFAVLPRLFATMPGGSLFGGAFFLLLSMAAITSTISILEVPVSHFVDRKRWSRRKAVAITTTCAFALAIPSALGNGAVSTLTTIPVLGLDFLTLMSTVWNNFALPLGGLLTAIFVGWYWKIDPALDELCTHNAWFPAPRLWGFLIRWICPIAITSILVASVMAMI